MTGEAAQNRKLFEISGPDRVHFLQGLVTNDVEKLSSGLVYAALLTPQGKYLADFFLLERGDAIILDVDASLADDLIRRLTMYRLRAQVTITPSALHVSRGLGTPPDGALPDPRHAALGWRHYADAPGDTPEIDWVAIRVAHCIPETGIELTPDTFVLEAGFERLNGVDFRKGCYVGQEIAARMKHKTELRKGLTTVTLKGSAPVGTSILADGKPAGTIFSQSGDRAIAFLRFDRAKGNMLAGDATVTYP
ncbi:folate-binding protein [Pseudohalocynthiibacter sp. F2068]|jgi:tRNA-modifying protein YgfZ|uniref:CAF17-like 4Fe-4S cluster assembly/insertion protein YgfZ n=1 Tax=Pseudohalocynthiibacter sp. F2068 TaxID=2926418 RepID=UPI001FF51022|nr:folate-binding protein [Pseudohalocynthiibacter sp. F2068]MCK0103348.1 folate-binding protein [Pseudohalocynthiibacter sp. F2068]